MTQLYRSTFRAMGSPCELQFYAETSDIAHQYAQDVVADIEILEARYSRFREDSFLSSINRSASEGKSIRVDEETASLIDYAQTCYEQSNGLFDITAGVLREIWNFKQNNIPHQNEIPPILSRVGFDKLQWENPWLHFSISGMELDFGGIVKEYAADRAANILLNHGIKHGMINLGGDIHVIGPHIDGRPWQIGIRDPQDTEQWIHHIQLVNGAIASSGDYLRFIEISGKRYGHILNPLTGWPVSGLSSVTVVSSTCLVAGSICTIAMLKEGNGIDWLKELEVPCFWVNDKGQTGGSVS